MVISRRKTLALLLLLNTTKRSSGRRRRGWMNAINQRRKQQGDFYLLVSELRLDRQRHHQYFRMSAEKMDELLALVGPELTRQSTNYKAPIDPKQRLAVGLRYLASGDSMRSLAFSYRLGQTTVKTTVHMVCAAVEKVMMGRFLPRPTRNTWEEVAQGFWERWNFPNCLGALDGKYVSIHAPPQSGSESFDYKTFSIVLALVDAEYRFRVIQVGDFGRIDGSLYAQSDLGTEIANGTFELPPRAPLPGAAHLGDVPFVMVGDAALPLKPYLMRPFPGQNLTYQKRVFNYRLSRARRVVENAFGILASRWRILYNKINIHPKNVDTLVMAACILHNFLLDPSDNQRLLNEADEHGRRMASVRNMGGNRASREACNVRETFTSFFNSVEGSVPWQDKMV